MKLLVTGASGYLGRRLVRRAASRHDVFSGYRRDPDVVPAGRPVHLDLERPETVEAAVRGLGVDAIVHTAAVNPGGPEGAMATVNVGGSRAVAAAAAAVGARLVHVSTDVVHDGNRAPYGDDDEPSPRGLYPETKAAAEAAVRELLPSAAIVRTSLIYAVDELDHGTAGFAERLARGEGVRLFSDVLRQPVWAEDLAEALLRLVETPFAGRLNVAGSEALSRDAYGRLLLAFWGLASEDDIRVESIRAAEVAPAVPRDLRLKLDRARRVLGMELPGVREVLAGFRDGPSRNAVK